MIKTIEIPDYIRSGIKHNDISFPKRLSFWGADYETVNGEPYAFSVCGKDRKPDFFFVNRENVFKNFIKYFEPRVLSGQVNVVYFHNLQFDLSVLLIKFHKDFVGKNCLDFEYRNCRIKAVIGNITFCRIDFESKKSIFLYDSFAFVKGSLEKLCIKLDLSCRKSPKPPDLGRKKDTSKKYIEYSKNDSLCQYYLAEWIIRQHQKYNLRLCVSAPQFSMRIFRHFYMNQFEVIKFPSEKIVKGAILSYHGGKNGFYLDKPQVIKNCTELDINSAYPYAMSNLPNFVKGNYFGVKRYTKNYQGIYNISGEVRDCIYPIFFSHDFKPVKKEFSRLWVTSYELKEALRLNELKNYKIHRGYLWNPDKKYRHNPVQEFVKEFWSKKESAKTAEEKELYKLILNSFYGKFIQAIKIDSGGAYIDEDKKLVFTENVFKAGGIFNPFIATLITGFTRAQIHGLEHKYQAIHSATDSIKTVAKIDRDKLPKGLGGLKIEVQGDCTILRNKLYIHKNEKGEIKKYALHGFTGNLQNLICVIKSKKNNYKTKRLLKVREAIRQHLKPLVMTVLDRELDVDLTSL